MTKHDVLGIARRWLLLLVLSPILAGFIGYSVVRQVPPVYEAATLLELVPGGAGSGGEDLGVVQQLTHTYIEVIQTTNVLEQAADQVGLGLSASALRQRVHASQVRDTRLIRIAAEDTDPQQAATLANAVARVFLTKNATTQSMRFASSRDSLARLVDELRGGLEAHRAQMDQLRAQPADVFRDAELARLQGELTQLETSYNATLRSYEDLRIAEARGANTLLILEEARPPDEPVRPSWRMVTALAALAGLAVAIGFLALFEYLDDVLRNDARIRRATGLATLGLAPRSTAPDRPGAAGDARTLESYRLIVNNLLVATSKLDLRALMITGPSRNEGKSLTAANLALALAEADFNVVLVDADLHRGRQAQLFGVPNRRGLTTLLLNRDEPAAGVLQATQHPNLRLLPAGPPPEADPSALLTRTPLVTRLEEFSRLSDVVVVDTPPVLARPDALLLASLVDASVLVVDATKSRGRDSARAVELLQRSGAVLVGVILNRVAPKRVDYVRYGGLRSVQRKAAGHTDDTGAAQPAGHLREGAP
jgi:capsular exopolysaccharide synthesis family protein